MNIDPMTEPSNLKIVYNNKPIPVHPGKNNDCYEVTYETPDGYGGTERKGFSIEARLFLLMRSYLQNNSENIAMRSLQNTAVLSGHD